MIICRPEIPSIPGTSFVCAACPCGEIEIDFNPDDRTVLVECPHMVQVIQGHRVLEIHSLGVRQ